MRIEKQGESYVVVQDNSTVGVVTSLNYRREQGGWDRLSLDISLVGACWIDELFSPEESTNSAPAPEVTIRELIEEHRKLSI